MATEIERKFLVTGSSWRTRNPTYYCQGYLNHDKNRTVRVRLRRYSAKKGIADESGVLTIKGLTIGASRQEYEYNIPVTDAKELLSMCDGPMIEKMRHVVNLNGLTWEIDEFLGDNEGLIIAEVELVSESQVFIAPDFLAMEVTHDDRYFNSNLSVRPYKQWQPY